MQYIEYKRFFYIDSIDRISGTSSNFSYNLQIPQNELYDMAVVTQLSIPVSYYLIESGYNTFTLLETGPLPSISVEKVITIPEGNYNVNSFCLVVGALLTTNSPTSSTYVMSFPVSFTAENSGKITITYTGPAVGSQLIFLSSNTVNEQFGFDSGQTATFTNNTLISANVVTFTVTRSLLIHSDICDSGHNNILQEVYSNNSQQLSNITYQQYDLYAYSKPLKKSHKNTINIYLTDVYNNAINLNGQNWNFTMLMYKKCNTYPIIEAFLQYYVKEIEKEQTDENINTN